MPICSTSSNPSARPAQRVGMFGITFKPGTDDIRESAAARVAQRLADDGCEVFIHDPRVEFRSPHRREQTIC